MVFRKGLISLALATLVAVPAGAQQAQPRLDVPSYFSRYLKTRDAQNLYWENFLVQAMADFRRMAGPDQVLNRHDIDTAKDVQLARFRSRIVQRIMGNDLNGDGKVTADEIRDALISNRDLEIYQDDTDGLIKGFLDADANNDHVISTEEAESFAARRPLPQIWGNPWTIQVMEVLLSFAPQDAQSLNGRELEAAARAAFQVYDLNDDLIIDPKEGAGIAQTRQDPLARATENCLFPKPSANAKIVVISGSQSGTLSDVTIAGQGDSTQTQQLSIKKGTEPLYIIATAKTFMIWQVTGDAQRVERLISAAGSTQLGASGVTGLPSSKVNFALPGCMFALFPEGRRPGGDLTEAIKLIVGREPAELLIGDRLSSFAQDEADKDPASQPMSSSQEIEFAPNRAKPMRKGGDEITYKTLMRGFPGGVAELDPRVVVTPGKAERYEVLPEIAGILQLEEEGLVRGEGQGSADQTYVNGHDAEGRDVLIPVPSQAYRIVKPIPRFPAGLIGKNSVTFILDKGVPMPKGSAGASSIISAETGKPLPHEPMGRPNVDPFLGLDRSEAGDRF